MDMPGIDIDVVAFAVVSDVVDFAVVSDVIGFALLSEARSRLSAGLLPNAFCNASTPSSFFDSASLSAWASLPLTRSSTFTNWTSEALTDVNALILSTLAFPALMADRSELKLGCIATSPLDSVVFFAVVSWADESDGVTIAAMAAVATAARRVRVCIGDSLLTSCDARQRSP